MEAKLRTTKKEETKSLGAFCARFFRSGDVVLLKGDLGAGKTTFTGGVAKGLGIEEDVISPTFNIMKCYFKGSLPMYHIDVYRLENQNTEIGLDEYIEGDGVCLIEWPMYIEKLLPDEFLEISLHNVGGDEREIVFHSDSPRFDELIKSLQEEFYENRIAA